MRHRLKFLALLIVNICLLGIYNKLENQDLNLETIRAHVKVFFRSGSPIKATPAPTWNEVGNVFHKRSLWKETESSNNPQISGCTPPKVGVTDLLYIFVEGFPIIPSDLSQFNFGWDLNTTVRI